MDLWTFFWVTLSGFLTLSIFSFLYRDNPFYRFAEHLYVGISAGWFAIQLWHGTLAPNLFQRLSDGDWYLLWLNAWRWEYIIPGVLGALMFTRFSRKYSWLSRWPMALYIGIGAGVAVPLEMVTRINKQMYAMMSPINWDNFWGNGWLDIESGYSGIIMLVGTIAALIYFFFSKPHTGLLGGVARVGVWTLMIGFGASFGYTVMARMALLIERIQFLDLNWIRNAFDGTSEDFVVRQFLFWAVIAAFVMFAVIEVIRGRSAASSESE